MHWEIKKFMTCFIVILTLLWSGTEPKYLRGMPVLESCIVLEPNMVPGT